MAWLASYRLRILFRSAFLLLALATIAMALHLLQAEKQLSYRNYRYGFHKTEAQISAKLHHPAGQLALLNPPTATLTPLRPLLLPFSALDFDDQNKVQQAIEMAGCLVQYRDGSVCVAVGNNPWAGAFIYVAGSFSSAELVPHRRGEFDLTLAHRVRVEVALRGQRYRWVAPFELIDETRGVRGRLTGFVEGDRPGRPVRDFRGWLWQNPQCQEAAPPCQRRAFFSLRLPVAILGDELFRTPRPDWPPPDLDRIAVHLQVLPPGQGTPLLDSNDRDATAPFSLAELAPLLLPGETLRIGRLGQPPLLTLVGSEDQPDDGSRLLYSLIKRLPVEGYDSLLESRELIRTPLGDYTVTLTGDVRSVNRTLGAVASRLSWFVGAMLLAMLLAWLVIEIGLIRRITRLTRRAASVAQTVKGAGDLERFDLADLRGGDELGILAGCLSELLRRVREDVERECIRAEQEKDRWHAVGHEIMSPLQSLLALYGDGEHSRYIRRMQQALQILYGSASPSEAFQSSTLRLTTVDLGEFLFHVADNAPCVGIESVRFINQAGQVFVRADEYSLEDVVTHVLRNADRYRLPDSPITITLEASETAATVSLHNQGPTIAEPMLDKIFEYGVSDQPEAGANGNRGQGLFVAKTYMAKMGGTIAVRNEAAGVSFVLSLQRVVAPG
ncbi:sensor histidine kinase [Chitinimonas lacunae]|uniref:histidine kinase n=1 Tax=Chitinimonas lacunae TaxID=1963018 RepID=A0ABV8MLR0_9NEIS